MEVERFKMNYDLAGKNFIFIPFNNVKNKVTINPTIAPIAKSFITLGTAGNIVCSLDMLCVKIPPETNKRAIVPTIPKVFITTGKDCTSTLPSRYKILLLLDFLIRLNPASSILTIRATIP
jgi:hypothetical protein